MLKNLSSCDGGLSLLRVVDLFCGAGGLSEGFRQAGFEIAAGVDTDPDACATYALNFPEATTIYGDLRKRRIREQVLELAQGVALVIGGPPCQAFSQVRNHDRLFDDPRNSLYREFVRVIRAVLPPGFLMENVPGLDQVGAREQILKDLSLDGEYVVRSQVVDAVDFGVPQTRKRLIFIGLRAASEVEVPTLVGTGASSRLCLQRTGKERIRYVVKSRSEEAKALLERLVDPLDDGVVTVGQALSDLEVLRSGSRNDEISYDDLGDPSSAFQRNVRADAHHLTNVSIPRINADTLLRLAGIPKGGNYRDLSGALTKRYLTGQRWGPENGSGRLGRRHYYAYRRLHDRFWSWTLNTKADSVYHPSGMRALSVREFARLQSFPDAFTFTTDQRQGELPGRISGGAAHSRYRQAGNAVPPRLARSAARALSKVLSLIDPPPQAR